MYDAKQPDGLIVMLKHSMIQAPTLTSVLPGLVHCRRESVSQAYLVDKDMRCLTNYPTAYSQCSRLVQGKALLRGQTPGFQPARAVAEGHS